MLYKLKAGEPEFQVTKDGEFEYKTFKRDALYDRIPEEEIHRFEIVKGGDDQ